MHTLFLEKSTKPGNEHGCGVVSVFIPADVLFYWTDDAYGFQVLAAIFSALGAAYRVCDCVCKDWDIFFPLGMVADSPTSNDQTFDPD